jgi:hypothetical protein
MMIEYNFMFERGFVFGFGFPVSGTEGVEPCAKNTNHNRTLIYYDFYD